MIKAAFFDVDGTLLSHEAGGVPKSARDAIHRLQERGTICALATGRHSLELANLPEMGIEFDAKLLLSGQICISGDGTPLFDVPVSPALAASLVEAFEHAEVALQLVEYDRCYINYVDARVTQVFADIISPTPPIDVYEGAPIYMGVAIVDAKEEARLAATLPDCHITRWHDGAVDIVAPGFSKATAIKRYCKLMGISQKETIAFGDSENDREMLEWCGIGVAMGNADDKTKALADYVAADIDDDGLARAIYELLF